ncbi:MAG: ATP-binding protein [bacterium]
MAFGPVPPSRGMAIELWDPEALGDELAMATLCQAIAKTDLICADLTTLDPQVMLALGYAIGMGIAVWLFADFADAEAFQALGRLTPLVSSTPRTYASGHDIARWFLYDLPEYLGGHWPVPEALSQWSISAPKDEVLWLHERMPSSGVNRLELSLSTLGIAANLSNMAVVSAHPLTWSLPELFAAPALICQFLPPLSNRSERLQNAQVALIAGMAHALGRPLLLLDEVGLLDGVDCRGVVHVFDGSSGQLAVVDDWHCAFAPAWADLPLGEIARLVQVKLQYPDAEVLIRRIMADLEAHGVEAHPAYGIKLALRESLTNAYRHGNRGEIDLPIHVRYCIHPARFDLVVQAQGDEFHLEDIVDCTRPENLLRTSGRGIFLIRQVMDEVETIGTGDGLRMCKYLSPTPHGAALG